MNVKPLAVFTTFYPEGRKFFPDFIHSLANQSDNNYHLIIGLDRIDALELDFLEKIIVPKVIIESQKGESPVSLRCRALELLIDQYDGVIFIDSDDILCPSRIEAARKMLEKDIVYGCAMRIIDENGNYLSKDFQYPYNNRIASEIPLMFNIYGMTNTAYSSSILKKCLPISDDVKILDWYLATKAWILGASFQFDRIPRMNYRQYGNNIAKVIPPFSGKYISFIVELLIDHYNQIINIPNMQKKYYKMFLSQIKDLSNFKVYVINDKDTFKKYLDQLNSMQKSHIWWDFIMDPELDYLWRSDSKSMSKLFYHSVV